jgi:hypothetical protein
VPPENVIRDDARVERVVMKRPMVAFLTQLLLAIRSRFTRRARLEAENLILRQQLIVLRRNSPDARETVEPRSFAVAQECA